MDAIAARGGVAKPSVYRAFGSKVGLYRAVADWFIGLLLDDIDALADTRMPLRPFIESVIGAVLGRIQADANVYHFLMRRARLELSADSTLDSSDDFLRQLSDHVGIRIAAHLRGAGHDVEPAALLAHAVVGMINNVADWWLDHDDVAVEKVVDTLAAILWTGFEPWERPGTVPIRADRPTPGPTARG